MLVVEDHIGSDTRVAHRDEVQVTHQLASHLVELDGEGDGVVVREECQEDEGEGDAEGEEGGEGAEEGDEN